MIKTFKKSITFSPEFLTAANAVEDFKKQKYMLFGGQDVEYWQDIFILCKGFTPMVGTIPELILNSGCPAQIEFNCLKFLISFNEILLYPVRCKTE